MVGCKSSVFSTAECKRYTFHNRYKPSIWTVCICYSELTVYKEVNTDYTNDVSNKPSLIKIHVGISIEINAFKKWRAKRSLRPGYDFSTLKVI